MIRLTALSATVVMLGMLTIDFLMFGSFSAYHGMGRSWDAYADYRFGSVLAFGAAPAAAAQGPRDFSVQPLSLIEKARYAGRIHEALPTPAEGWSLRPYRESDFWVLRPDLAFCKGQMGLGRASGCPFGVEGGDVWVLEGPSGLLALSLHYRRGQASERDHIAGPVPSVMMTLFGSQYKYRKDYRDFGDINGLAFGALAQMTNPAGVADPVRIMAQVQGDGELLIFAAGRLPEGDLRKILSGLDSAFLTALIAPLPGQV